ncbi:MAG: DNA primase [Lentisphaeria bacterium]|nr:DNA primase [Lentisphaeria bacterium]
MSFIPEEIIEEVRARADIVEVVGAYVSLQKRGGEFWCCCPFHKEKTPSFKLNATMGMYHCFGCGASGNVFGFVREMENVDFPSAVRLLARQTGVHIPETPLPDTGSGHGDRDITKDTVLNVLGKAADWFRQQLALPEARFARDYLSGRGLDKGTATRFGLGYAPDSWDALLNWGQRQGMTPKLLLAAGLIAEREQTGGGTRVYDRFRNRIMFPIWDDLGRVAGFSGRVLQADAQSAKYVNSPETITFHKSRLLYCLNLARKAFKESGKALVCEGQLDTIACHRAGLTHAVAPQGTAFTEDQARILRRHTEHVVFAFDADAAGVKAAARSVEVALQANLRPRVVVMPDGQDPDGIFQQMGADELRAVMSRDQDAFEFLFDTAATGKDLRSPHDKDEVVKRLLGVISQITQPVTQAGLCQWLAAKVGVPEAVVFASLDQLLKQQARSGRFSHRESGRHSETSRPGPPPFHMGADGGAPETGTVSPPSAVRGAVENLLDLSLRYRAIAEQLVVNEHLTKEALGQTAVEKALLLVLQRTAEEKWDAVGRDIGADQALAADPVVGRLLHSSRYKDPNDEAHTENEKKRWEQRLNSAVEDCVRTIENDFLGKREAELRHQLAQAEAGSNIELMKELTGIAQRRRNLHPSNR